MKFYQRLQESYLTQWKSKSSRTSRTVRCCPKFSSRYILQLERIVTKISTPSGCKQNSQPVEANSEMVILYFTIFNTISAEALLKLLMILRKIFKGNNIKTGPQHWSTTKNILAGEALLYFEQKVREKGNTITMSYKLVIQGLTTQLFSKKVLQWQNRSLYWCLFNTR